MVEIRKIQKAAPLSAFRSYTPQGGAVLRGLADAAKVAYEDFLGPIAVERMQQEGDAAGLEWARGAMAGIDVPAPESVSGRPAPRYEPGTSPLSAPPGVQVSALQDLIDQTEGGGDYDTLFGYSNRSGPFAGTAVSQMTIGALKNFSNVRGAYGQWVKNQVGRVATPMGRYQIVGTTLRRAAQEVGLSDDVLFDRGTQDMLFEHLARRRLQSQSTMQGKIRALRQEWEGFKHVSDERLMGAIRDFENPRAPAQPEAPSQDSPVSTPQGPAPMPVRPTTSSGRPMPVEEAQFTATYLPDFFEERGAPQEVVNAVEAALLFEEAVETGRHPVTGEDLGDTVLQQQRANLSAAHDTIKQWLDTNPSAASDAPTPRPHPPLWSEPTRSPHPDIWTAPKEELPAVIARSLPSRVAPGAAPNVPASLQPNVSPSLAPNVSPSLAPVAPGSTAPVASPSLAPVAQPSLGAAVDPETLLPSAVLQGDAAAGEGAARGGRPSGSPPGAVVRTRDGNLEMRLFSPASGPILQAYNAAAKAAAFNEISLQSQSDMLNLSQQFEADPEGFQEAATSYIDEIVSKADPMFRRDLRGQLQEEAQRRYLGVLDERHTDIRNRASNSNRALVDRYAQDYQDAILTGDTDAAAAARYKLDSALYSRESLPGLAWTPEQSANVIADAERGAATTAQRRRDEQAATWKTQLDTIIEAHERGGTSAHDHILQNPEVWATNPELAREAQAKVLFSQQVPSFNRMTPEQQDAAVSDMRDRPVSEDWEFDLIDAAEDIAKANRRAWEEDPIARAAEVLDTPPPQIPSFTPESPEAFLNGLQARREYAERLFAEGYVDEPVYLSLEEAENLGTLLGKGTPDEIRAGVAGVLVEGFGSAAVSVFGQVDAPRELRLAGQMAASGGDPAIIGTALQGQRMIDEGIVRVPAAMGRLDAMSPEIAAAINVGPGDAISRNSDILALAKTIYAGMNGAAELEGADQQEAMEQAVQKALGQSVARGQTTGGVQEINDHMVWLPIGVAGQRVRDGLRSLSNGVNAIEQWDGIAADGMPGGEPYIAGQPMPLRLMIGARLVPVGDGLYGIEVERRGDPLDVATESGQRYVIDIRKLIQ